MAQRTGECVYCAATAELTTDHIPPKSLFAKPRPPNLIAVPSCAICNQTASKDDEYFRATLSLNDAVHDHPDVQANLPTVLRSLEKPAKRAFRRGFLRTFRTVEMMTPRGLYLGEGLAFDVDLVRLQRVVCRTIKGLFFHECRRRLPDGYAVHALSEDGLRDTPSEALATLRKTIVRPLLGEPLMMIGSNVFNYRFKFTTVEPNTSAWLLEFYGRIRFLCVTIPIEFSPSHEHAE